MVYSDMKCYAAWMISKALVLEFIGYNWDHVIDLNGQKNFQERHIYESEQSEFG